jgi:uncharacterized SAM-binding protein YcdF (DUF218 family)
MTDGRLALVRLLSRVRVYFVARRCRVTIKAVYNWTSGTRRPNRRARRALESYGIPADSWR